MKTITQIIAGQQYLFPRYKTYCSDNINGYGYFRDSRPYLIEICDTVKLNTYLTQITFKFIGTFLTGEYCIVVSENAYYDELHRILKKHDDYEIVYPERDLDKLLFNITPQIREKINNYNQLKDEHLRVSQEMMDAYRKEIDCMVKGIEDFESYETELDKYVK